jgi:erythromycin esterase
VNSTPSAALSGWLRQHATVLKTIEPAADLDDLEPLREVVGNARVVAIGENAHFIEEFSSIRQRVLRFLAERCGFTVFAFEFSFAGAPKLDRWLSGYGRDCPLGEVSPAAADWGASGLMHWLRQHNLTSKHPLRFIGIDLPEAGGALRPVLEPLADYLRDADPESLPLVEKALEISDSFLAGLGSGAAAAPAWAQLDAAQQDALTSSLARLQLRLRAVEPIAASRTEQHRHEVAERMLAAACTVDYMFRAMNDLFSGTGMSADLSVREIYMAESVRWHLQHTAQGTRIALAAHNNHIQKTPNAFGGAITALPMGQHLARMMGDGYVAIAATHTADHVPEMHPDSSAPVGFTLQDVGLPDPPPGSIEAGLIDAGLGGVITLTDLHASQRDGQGQPLLTGIRTQSTSMRTPLPDAFDAVITSPTVTRDHTVKF